MRSHRPHTLAARRAAAVRRRRRRRRSVPLVLAVVAAALGAIVLGTGALGSAPRAQAPPPPAAAPPLTQATLGPAVPARVAGGELVRAGFRRPPRAGLLVDLDTGRVLWSRAPDRALPIASLTKMMTALVASERLSPRDRARITGQVLNYSGSGMGVLPRGKQIKVETLLNGLLLPSGNDAARALALRTSGTLPGFVREMNARRARFGLGCTRFASVEGLSDGNRSCPRDLIALASRVLDEPRLARIVRRRRAVLPMPIEGGRAHLTNHNPLVLGRYPGVLGIKTGYTRAAGRCLVAAARRGGRRLAVVVLRSHDPGRQARRLLDRGFTAIR